MSGGFVDIQNLSRRFFPTITVGWYLAVFNWQFIIKKASGAAGIRTCDRSAFGQTLGLWATITAQSFLPSSAVLFKSILAVVCVRPDYFSKCKETFLLSLHLPFCSCTVVFNPTFYSLSQRSKLVRPFFTKILSSLDSNPGPKSD